MQIFHLHILANHFGFTSGFMHNLINLLLLIKYQLIFIHAFLFQTLDLSYKHLILLFNFLHTILNLLLLFNTPTQFLFQHLHLLRTFIYNSLIFSGLFIHITHQSLKLYLILISFIITFFNFNFLIFNQLQLFF